MQLQIESHSCIPNSTQPCQAIVEIHSYVYANTKLKEVIHEPTEEEWLAITKSFWNIWNFPNCLGHQMVNFEAPANRGSVRFNYKGTSSILTLADANCSLIMIDVGSFGISDVVYFLIQHWENVYKMVVFTYLLLRFYPGPIQIRHLLKLQMNSSL